MTFKFSFGKKNDSDRTAIDLLLNKKKLSSIILLGDSVLDSFYWIENHKHDVEHALRKYLNTDNNNNKTTQVYNLSIDDFTIDTIISGLQPNPLFVKARHTFNLPPYRYLNQSDGTLYPIRTLSSLITQSEIKVQIRSRNPKKRNKNQINPTVVLSIMMNDIRNNLQYGKPELITEALRKQNYTKKLENIVKILTHKLKLNVILVIGFEPHESFTESEILFSRDDLLTVWDFVVCKLLIIAERYECPVIDLSRTLNAFDRTHYGSTAIELSDYSQQFLVELIIETLARFEFGTNDYGDVDDEDMKTSMNTIENAANTSKSKSKSTYVSVSPKVRKSPNSVSNKNRSNSYFNAFMNSPPNSNSGSGGGGSPHIKTVSKIYYGVVQMSSSDYNLKLKLIEQQMNDSKALSPRTRVNQNLNLLEQVRILDIREEVNNKTYRKKYYSLMQNRAPQASDMDFLLDDIIAEQSGSFTFEKAAGAADSKKDK